ncbi:amidohydrolase [Rhodococcus gannanensis]|uniref:Amidohydrolase n=1 Tax=Rhodococcus gannanensis TaxID=1960308 RepID=A0ABW4P0G5_9NOCA
MTSEPTIIYPAALVRTMDPARPTAEAVAVRGNRIRAVGTVEELQTYPNTVIDDRYADRVIVPGFVEAHSHNFGGALWNLTYVGRFERVSPDGRRWPGCESVDEILERLRAIASEMPDDGSPLLAWGLDPIYYPGFEVTATELDTVSTTRPIVVMHASGHLSVVNSFALAESEITAATDVIGVRKHADGTPTGVLAEPAAMSLVKASAIEMARGVSATTFENFAADAVNQGVTTATDLGSAIVYDDAQLAELTSIVDDSFPMRVSTFGFGSMPGMGAPTNAAERVAAIRDRSTDRLRLGHVKLILDGSIQGFTARLQEPGYYNDAPNGIWVTDPAAFEQAFGEFHRAGLTIHVHCNGDQATQVFIEVLERTLAQYPRWDHRHTVTHSQLTTAAQYKRLAALGACANIFSNHIWTWGDQHRDSILGPDRASRMNAAATALRCGVPFTLHSDTPVTPLGPLQTMKHAVTRLTPSGRVLGAEERITAEQALHAVTLGGAYTLKMDHEVGSIEAGKLADFAILDADPLAVPEAEIGEITVFGTVVGGAHYAAAAAPALVG